MAENQEERRSSSLPGCLGRYKHPEQKSRKWIKRMTGVLLAACLFLLSASPSGSGVSGLTGGGIVPGVQKKVQAAEMEYIRVGLKSQFEKISQLTIQNTALTYGYCIDSVFYPDETLYSGNGFTLQAESGSYAVCQGTYQSYASAVRDAALIRSMYGIALAYPASTGKGKWKIYIPSGAVRNTYTAGGLLGLSSSSLADKLSGTTRSSEHMLFVKTQNGAFLIDAELAGSYPQFAAVPESGKTAAVVKLAGGKGTAGTASYRGRIEAGRYGNNGVTAVNVLPLEQYLYGVVPSEMSYSWPAEALKAQAVCARGYALLTAGPGSSGTLTRGYKVSDTTLHQAYRGYDAEQESTSRAVDATRGETVCYENQVVKTYYFSTSGGSTEAVEDVWGSNISYLRSVADIYEDNPSKKPWLVSMTGAEILSRIRSKSGNIGAILSIKPEIRTQSGRIYALKIEGTQGSITLEKEQVRSVLGLYSTKFKVISYGETPDRVSVLSADGMTEKRISESYVISGSRRTERMDTSMEQYMVLSAGNRTGFAGEGPKNSDSYVFAGTGYGHGVGMSQSGARGMAEAGYTYKEILAHYFTGTTVR